MAISENVQITSYKLNGLLLGIYTYTHIHSIIMSGKDAVNLKERGEGLEGRKGKGKDVIIL